MEVTAKLRNLKMGCRKGRYVADMVRQRPVAEALTILQGCPRAAARPIAKLLRSAVANAEQKNEIQHAGIEIDNLVVSTIFVDEGPSMWRVRPRAQGRAAWIQKRTASINVVLSER